jgi:hypothetical protein
MKIPKGAHSEPRGVKSVYRIPLAVAAGAAASRLVLAHAPPRIATDLAQALPVATAWGTYGALLWTILAATLAFCGIAYADALRSPVPLRDTWYACALSCLAGFAWLPLFSSDVYAYAAYGELARLGFDPYTHARPGAHDAVIAAADWQWSGLAPICVYGPAFVALVWLVAVLLSHAPVIAHLEVLRALACASLLAVPPIGARGRDARRATLLALHPVVLWSAVEGHNDVLMLAAALGGVAIARTRPALGTAAAMLAATIKLPAIAAGGALARRAPLVFALGAVAVIASYLPLIAGVLADLAPRGHYDPVASVQSLGWPAALALALALAARLRAFDGADRWCALALLAWLAIPNPYPWYATWLVPLLLWARDPRVRLSMWIVGAAAMLHTLADATGTLPQWAAWLLGLAATVGYVPLFTRGIMTRS